MLRERCPPCPPALYCMGSPAPRCVVFFFFCAFAFQVSFNPPGQYSGLSFANKSLIVPINASTVTCLLFHCICVSFFSPFSFIALPLPQSLCFLVRIMRLVPFRKPTHVQKHFSLSIRNPFFPFTLLPPSPAPVASNSPYDRSKQVFEPFSSRLTGFLFERETYDSSFFQSERSAPSWTLLTNGSIL